MLTNSSAIGKAHRKMAAIVVQCTDLQHREKKNYRLI
jgi:hypothetical protein